MMASETPRQTEPTNETRQLAYPGVRGELVLVVAGLFLGILLYYSRQPPWPTVGLIVMLAASVYLALSLKYANPTSYTELHITRRKAGIYALIGLLVILPGWFFDSLYMYLTGRGWLQFGIATVPSLVISIVAIAIAEELFFRGYVQGRLKSIGGNRWVRIVVVCALFMFYKVLIHVWDGWSVVIYLEFFLFGAFKMLFETFWVDWTGSIVTPIVIHIGWDLIIFQGYAGLPPWAL
jgi:membrane protease YdiL (CAAX protease family)